MILLTLSYLKYSSKTFLYYCNSFNAFIFIYVYIIFYSNSTVGPDIKGTEWIQRRFGKGNKKKRQILCKFLKHVFLHITKYFFLFHFSKKEYSDFIFYMSWKIPIKKHTLQSRNASDLCLVKCFKIFHMNYLGFHILKRFPNSFHLEQ